MPSSDLPDLDFLDALEDIVLSTLPGPAEPRPHRQQPRDTGRIKVYRAEHAFHPNESIRRASGVGDRFPCVEFTRPEMLAFVRKVESSDWWGDNACTAAQARPVDVTTRSKRRGRAYYSENRISMPAWTWYDEYVLHELTHLAVGTGPLRDGTEAAHGASFVRLLHGLIREFMGYDAAIAFEQGCRREGIACPATDAIAVDTHEYPMAAGVTQPMDTVGAWDGYAESYRKYRTGGRASAPKPRKGMTSDDVARVRAMVDATL